MPNAMETGEGGVPPLPVSPTPNGDGHHGPLYGDRPEKNHMMPVGPQAYRMKICR